MNEMAVEKVLQHFEEFELEMLKNAISVPIKVLNESFIPSASAVVMH